jgi:hypothetical protein
MRAIGWSIPVILSLSLLGWGGLTGCQNEPEEQSAAPAVAAEPSQELTAAQVPDGMERVLLSVQGMH